MGGTEPVSLLKSNVFHYRSRMRGGPKVLLNFSNTLNLDPHTLLNFSDTSLLGPLQLLNSVTFGAGFQVLLKFRNSLRPPHMLERY